MPAIKVVNSDFDTLLRQTIKLVNNTVQQLLAEQKISDGDLKKAIRYTLIAPGKRIRSVLVLWCCELICGKINRNAEIAAAAVEMVHTYSLVHDDLPAMDNDDFRRGQPTCHKAFGEATAILTGDALLTLAFEILAKKIDQAPIAVKLISQLAEAAGPAGMIAGQFLDTRYSILDARKAGKLGIKDLISRIEHIHTNKTAKMFRCAAAMGAICGGANARQLNRLSEYGLKIGLGFQITDDILDVCASSEQLGKTAGKDQKEGKTTYPAVIGLEKSKRLAKNLADEAIAIVKPFGHKADMLRQLAVALLQRSK